MLELLLAEMAGLNSEKPVEVALVVLPTALSVLVSFKQAHSQPQMNLLQSNLHRQNSSVQANLQNAVGIVPETRVP